jgi:hypothetical protein
MADKAAADPRDDNPVPMRKLVMTLLAISFGTILECESCSVSLQSCQCCLAMSAKCLHALYLSSGSDDVEKQH